MSRTITFEGASDDLAYVVDDGTEEEYQAYDGAQFRLSSTQGQMQVTVNVDHDSGCWHISAGQTDEAHPLPGWPVKLEQSPDTAYSTRLTIDAPTDTELVQTA